MKRLTFALFILLMLPSCATIKNQSDLVGNFNGATPGIGSFVPAGEMSLSLFPNGTFKLNWLRVDYSGTWKLSDKSHILLKFNEITDIRILLCSGVILDKERTVRFVSKNKIIMLPRDILKREK